MPKSAMALSLSAQDQKQLGVWLRASSTPQQVALRCRVALSAALGRQDLEIAAELKVNRHTAALWRKRVAGEGIGCVWEIAPGRGRKAQYDQTKRDAIIEATLETRPKGMTQWSCRLMAKAQRVSKNTISRLWELHNLKPHLDRTFKLSRDPKFLEKLTDVVGLYLNPPQTAVVLCVDEKSQIQALDRTQPGLPLKKGRCGTMTHDYKRNGTTTLFAAFNVLEGSVIGRCMQRHTHQEFIRFLNAIENQVPANKQVHVVLDNYATHKHPKVIEWLGRHRRFTFHFTPTSASWINAVEGFFAKLTNRRLKRGVFHSIVALQAAINRFVKEANQNPKPFQWTKDPDEIIATVRRGHQALDSHH